ncbi:GlxA family transcriptional regulator [Streptomyces sp. PT12]|uniref:GlxA family transcriptional regulator n=1 Tax=Streptomyces sp. PT12 TaxID=1510197 RepID=UPI000DE2A4D5|nr:helix-turn-helix domain-containing protein [Streptomyces sp. PT12]RBM05521.1 AraC family transcriptional regulator [Streptomyces sp. PT12]
MHTVAVLALEGVIPFDLVTPVEVFGRSAGHAYRVRVCGPVAEVDAGPFAMRVPHGLEALDEADTVVVPGLEDPLAPLPDDVIRALREAHARGARLASICVGTFTLAATGLLDGLRATTHWLAADELARRYPEVTVDPDVLFVDNGSVLTSAGAAAGLDLCLHMVRRDLGAAAAADAARLAVMPLERDGGQAQFIVRPEPVPDGASLEPLLRWLGENAHRDLRLTDIASHARLSTRTLNRRFREQTGTTPLRWLHRARVRRAQHLLETTGHSIERIATQVGFGSATAFRDAFKRLVGTSPLGYRRAFRV